MKRREFLIAASGLTLWPVTGRVQELERRRRIGVLNSLAADDSEGQARYAAFRLSLKDLGWNDGQNIRIETRWAASDPERFRAYAVELVALGPDVITATASPSVAALLQVTRSVPIVFANVTDPVGAGFVESLARPGGNVTGFTLFEFGVSVKWLELLKQVAPGVTRVAVLRDATLVAGGGQLGALQGISPSFGVELTPVGLRDAAEIERAITMLAREQNAGLIIIPSPLSTTHRDLIITLAARHNLPAVYPYRYFTVDGGLISYGPDTVDQWRQAASYVDRILKGEKPAEMPVLAPTKYELVVNLKTARALDLTVPPSLLARADEVIE